MLYLHRYLLHWKNWQILIRLTEFIHAGRMALLLRFRILRDRLCRGVWLSVAAEHAKEGVCCIAFHPGGIAETGMGQTAPEQFRSRLYDSGKESFPLPLGLVSHFNNRLIPFRPHAIHPQHRPLPSLTTHLHCNQWTLPPGQPSTSLPLEQASSQGDLSFPTGTWNSWKSSRTESWAKICSSHGSASASSWIAPLYPQARLARRRTLMGKGGLTYIAKGKANGGKRYAR